MTIKDLTPPFFFFVFLFQLKTMQSESWFSFPTSSTLAVTFFPLFHNSSFCHSLSLSRLHLHGSSFLAHSDMKKHEIIRQKHCTFAHSSTYLFAPVTHHQLACSTLLALLTRSVRLVRSSRSFRSPTRLVCSLAKVTSLFICFHSYWKES